MRIAHLLGKGPSLDHVDWGGLAPGPRIAINEAALVVPWCDAAVCCDPVPYRHLRRDLPEAEERRRREGQPIACTRLYAPEHVVAGRFATTPDFVRAFDPLYITDVARQKDVTDAAACRSGSLAFCVDTTAVTALHIAWWAFGATHVQCHGIDGEGGYAACVSRAIPGYPAGEKAAYQKGIESMRALAKRLGVTVAFVRWP